MQVRIYQPTKSAMQSPANQKKWCLEFLHDQDRSTDLSELGLVRTEDMLKGTKLFFTSLDDALSFASKKNYEYEVIESHSRSIKKKNYADNFL